MFDAAESEALILFHLLHDQAHTNLLPDVLFEQDVSHKKFGVTSKPSQVIFVGAVCKNMRLGWLNEKNGALKVVLNSTRLLYTLQCLASQSHFKDL